MRTEEKRITKIPTRNPEAYDNYLKGRFLLHQSTNEQRSDINREGLSSALQYFEKAVAADTVLLRHMQVWLIPGSIFPPGDICLLRKDFPKPEKCAGWLCSSIRIVQKPML